MRSDISQQGDSPEFSAPHPPSVSVIIPNYNGRRHLPACLESLGAQEYSSDLLEVIVVDNGSKDGSLELLSREYPWVRVLPQERNLGFAAAINLAAEVSTSECIALLNNDMRVDPDWVLELARAYDPDAGYPCVAGLILDWDGRTVDFAAGTVNFHAMGNQVGFGYPLDAVDLRDGRDLPFACGGSMLISRKLFLEVGAFDPGFFAYYEDVDLGWRLWLLGHGVRLAAEARSYHQHHGTASRFPVYQRILLYERNALRTLIKNLDEHNLGRLLSASLLLVAKRAVLDTSSPRPPFDIGPADRREAEKVPRNALARLHAISDVVDDLDSIMELRSQIQLQRRRTDAEIFAKFGKPFEPLGRGDEPYLEAFSKIVRSFNLDQIFQERKANRILFIAYDVIGERMAGPGIRCWEMARALGKVTHTQIANTTPIDRTAPGVETVIVRNDDDIRELAEEADIIIVQGHALHRFPTLRSARALLVVDLYDPWIFENLEFYRASPPSTADRAIEIDLSTINELLDRGDFFICASERQRDYWLGMLSARGRVDRGMHLHDPSLRTLIDVVPFGCPENPPRRNGPVLKGVHPDVGANDPIVIWGGGAWDWFDPLTVLEAFRLVVKQQPGAKLYFMGLELGGRDVPGMKMAELTKKRAMELGLAGAHVFFGEWVPYDERGAYLLEADVGVLATKDLAEARLSFRTRLLDHFWAGLPTVTTEGDVLADLIAQEEAGIVVAPGNVEEMANALTTLLTDSGRRQRCAERSRALASRFEWNEVVKPLIRIVEEPWHWLALRASRPRARFLTEDAQILLELRRKEIDALKELAGIDDSRAWNTRRFRAFLKRTPLYPLVKFTRKMRLRIKQARSRGAR